MAQRVGRTMIERGGGVIVNVASIYGERALDWRLYGHGIEAPRQDDAAYHVSKAAVIQLTRVLATSWAPFGVRVCGISPGPITTEYVQETNDEQALAQIAGRIPLQRLGSPSEIAACVGFLCSDDASFMTGTNLVVDGGWTCW
jgi:NAD(P)-dependent dehydrogenase (short-subunit alcohol dehydrogenase family)